MCVCEKCEQNNKHWGVYTTKESSTGRKRTQQTQTSAITTQLAQSRSRYLRRRWWILADSSAQCRCRHGYLRKKFGERKCNENMKDAEIEIGAQRGHRKNLWRSKIKQGWEKNRGTSTIHGDNDNQTSADDSNYGTNQHTYHTCKTRTYQPESSSRTSSRAPSSSACPRN